MPHLTHEAPSPTPQEVRDMQANYEPYLTPEAEAAFNNIAAHYGLDPIEPGTSAPETPFDAAAASEPTTARKHRRSTSPEGPSPYATGDGTITIPNKAAEAPLKTEIIQKTYSNGVKHVYEAQVDKAGNVVKHNKHMSYDQILADYGHAGDKQGKPASKDLLATVTTDENLSSIDLSDAEWTQFENAVRSGQREALPTPVTDSEWASLTGKPVAKPMSLKLVSGDGATSPTAVAGMVEAPAELRAAKGDLPKPNFADLSDVVWNAMSPEHQANIINDVQYKPADIPEKAWTAMTTEQRANILKDLSTETVTDDATEEATSIDDTKPTKQPRVIRPFGRREHAAERRGFRGRLAMTAGLLGVTALALFAGLSTENNAPAPKEAATAVHHDDGVMPNKSDLQLGKTVHIKKQTTGKHRAAADSFTLKQGDTFWKESRAILKAQGIKHPTVKQIDAQKDHLLQVNHKTEYQAKHLASGSKWKK